jgi:hypothetical protein
VGAPSKELWGMLMICVPTIVWQAWFFSQANAADLYFITVFEVAFVACSAYLVWRYGGLEEAVTKVLDVTRIWEPKPSVVQQEARTERDTKFCRYCGEKIPRDSSFCEECGKLLR